MTHTRRRLCALLATVALAAFPLAGCMSTLADVQAARGSGTIRTYPNAFDTVWDVALTSARSSGLSVVAMDKDRGSMLAQSTNGRIDGGENVAIYLTPANSSVQTKVEIISKPVLGGNPASFNWERRLLSDLDQRMAFVTPAPQDGTFVPPVRLASATASGSFTAPIAKDLPAAEKLARSLACQTEPAAMLTGKGASFETYSVACANGDSLSMRCEVGNCRVLK